MSLDVQCNTLNTLFNAATHTFSQYFLYDGANTLYAQSHKVDCGDFFFLPRDFGFCSSYTQISGTIRRLMKCYFCFTDTSTPRKSRSNVKNVGRDSVSPEL